MPILPSSAIDQAVERLLAGAIVAIPTDTVYGLACLPTHEAALGGLADLKGRDRDQPIAVLFDSVADVLPYLEDAHALDRYVSFWPGALTVVVSAKLGGLPTPIVAETEDSRTVGVRKPDDRVARAIIRGAGGLLAVTSANRHGAAPATSAAEVAAEFGDGLMIVNDGPRTGGVASTVVDASIEPPRILREGRITASDLGIEVDTA